MGRTKDAKNQEKTALPPYAELSSEERVRLLANLIVDRIIEDQVGGQKLLQAAESQDARPVLV